MTPGSTIYAGLMSGTSVDAVDGVLLEFSASRGRLLHHYQLPVPDNLRRNIVALSSSSTDSFEAALELDQHFGELFATCANHLVENSGIEKNQIAAIGSHGQTVRHRPPGSARKPYFTSQIGDPNLIAELTGIAVVADFRRRDMAAGGEAAPLVPPFHAFWFGEEGKNKLLVNLGGMANVTWLSGRQVTSGFDCGPGNALMDIWTDRHLGEPFDRDGRWAASGRVCQSLLGALLDEPWLSLKPPKSTGRELFNSAWLNERLDRSIAPADVQATLLEFTLECLLKSIETQLDKPDQIILCGGGARNSHLRERLSAKLPDLAVETTTHFGLEPEQVEAAAFAWLAKQRMENIPVDYRLITGASGPRVLGGIYAA